MIIILYISAAVAAAALIYAAVSAVRFKRNTAPDIKKINAATASMQTSVDEIKTETVLLSQKQKELQEDFLTKKTAVQTTAAEVKGTPHVLKMLWNAGKSDV
ncbi:hypothetical protein P9D25_19200 [Bacillus velezensis]|uniref:hypothetical protein n=1 Tax=Bacillus TaxID=1386 RepID=UPI000D01AA7E|nr:hypothetical protein [Bacillus velezensis]AVM08452.1 hypothetical protein C6P48_09535 [Bacillus velezensis]MEC1339775.1 hypothetical protein [Bacillus velezensis]QDF48850.1 conserved exported protein of unknown function [Bacillus velezensis]QDF52496.1 conserved exported protein of unknown function [Bacillus velezensis]